VLDVDRIFLRAEVIDELDDLSHLSDVAIGACERGGHEDDLAGAGVLEFDFSTQDVHRDGRFVVFLCALRGFDRVTETTDGCHVRPFSRHNGSRIP
jgi:hypothetical protein